MYIVRLLSRAEKFFDTPCGRRAFWMGCAALFIVFGVITVVRAEIPKEKYVMRLRYDSPMSIGSKEDKQAKYHSSEFSGFRRQAWGVIVKGMDPYDAEKFHVRAYPPFFNIAFMPFAAPWRLRGAGSAMFYVLSFGLCVLSAWFVSRCIRSDERDGFGLFALVFLFLVPMALNAMVRCETDMLVLAPVAAALMLLARRRRAFSAGLLLGFAAAFKVLPGLFGLYLLCRRKWAALGGMIAAAAFCTVLLPAVVFGPGRAWDLHASWCRAVVIPYHTEGLGAVIGESARPSNQSLAAALERTLRPVPVKISRHGPRRAINVVTLARETIRLVLKISQGVIGLGLVAFWILCARRRETPGRAAVLFASVAPGILLLSDVSLTSHHVLLILPLGVVLVRALALGERRARGWAWVAALYIAAVLGVGIPLIKAFTPMLPLTLALLAVCVALACEARPSGAEDRSKLAALTADRAPNADAATRAGEHAFDSDTDPLDPMRSE